MRWLCQRRHHRLRRRQRGHSPSTARQHGFLLRRLGAGDYSVVLFNNEDCNSIHGNLPLLNVHICSGGLADLESGQTRIHKSLDGVCKRYAGSHLPRHGQGFDANCSTGEYQIQDSLVGQPSSVCGRTQWPSGGNGEYSWEWTINGNSFFGSEFLNVQLGVTSDVCVTLSDGCSSPHAFSCTTIDVQEVDSTSVLDALGVCGGTSGDSDDDGICDDIDDCDGLTDECGICNGPGAIYECGCFEISDEYSIVNAKSIGCARRLSRRLRRRWFL